ncbi:MAG: cob(I)yrinic acid a,c-diamide adenosyltransferase [Burkholderiaceae bacterium]|jgi:cob(I)alamin adenosyltransferase|nr:cob(I)yrinic acid a,c-diamide adenosyltransferase [Burkholderiaceae bacterium]
MLKKTIRIMTKTGDQGMTSLADGSRISKASPRIDSIGHVDELNSILGLLITLALPEDIKTGLLRIQNELFTVSAELAKSSRQPVEADQVRWIEVQAEQYDTNLLPLRGFVLPGGSYEGALLHLARSVCRRAERSLSILYTTEPASDTLRRYMNRLSDLLFIYARAVNRMANKEETLWQPQERESNPVHEEN